MKIINKSIKFINRYQVLFINNEENQVIDEPKETVKIMDIPSSNTNASLVVSIDSNDDSKNDSI